MKQKDIHCQFSEEMFRQLVAGKEVIVEQADYSKWHFTLDDIGWNRMEQAIADAKAAESQAKRIVGVFVQNQSDR